MLFRSMHSLGWNFGKSSQDLANVLNDERYMDKQPIDSVFEKLQRLTKKPGEGPSAQTAAPQLAAV